MVYDWTEYILWGWGNIWEPLNLTVTASGTDATIKWEDNEIWTIPPTTFQKSELVRKIDSAPTSPSDWDLVVTETVKDTYKVSGYVDSWLTVGTTYYYRVFSYSDLWWISYCDAVSVTPSQWWWQPWEDTIAYWKFDGDLTDEMWNYNGTTSNFSANFVPLPWDSNIQCMQYSTSRWNITLPSSLWLELWTQQTSFSFWLRRNATTFTSSRDQFLCLNGSGSWRAIRFQYTHSDFWVTNSLTLVTWASGSGKLDGYPIAISTGVRYNLWFTYDHTTRTKTYYMNGQPLWSVVSGANYNTTNTAWNAKIYESDGSWYMSDMILEKKTWTAQEVSDYFDQTKANYWL
jgi:hypothetical protein